VFGGKIGYEPQVQGKGMCSQTPRGEIIEDIFYNELQKHTIAYRHHHISPLVVNWG